MARGEQSDPRTAENAGNGAWEPAKQKIIHVLANEGGFGDHLAVMDEGRHHGLGVELQIVRIELLAGEDVEIVAFPLNTFFSQNEAHLGCAHR